MSGEARPADDARGAAGLARLFFEFFKISLFVVGGGYAILAVADRVFSGKRLGWTREGELLEELPVLQMIPGLIAGNTAIYVGHKRAGRLGAAAALCGTAVPPFAIFLAVSCLMRGGLPEGNVWLDGALAGARAALAGMLAGTIWRAWKVNVAGAYGYFAAVASAAAMLFAPGVGAASVLVAAMLCGLALEFAVPPRGACRCSGGIAMALVFLKYGLLSFGGGYVLVPMYIEHFVGPAAPMLQLPPEEFASVIAMTQMTPGPVSINAATFFGYRLAGVAGAAVATSCLLLPSLFLLAWALESLEKWKQSRIVRGILRGVRPATTGLLVSAFWAFAGMSAWNTAPDGSVAFSAAGTALAAGSAAAFLFTRLPPAAVIFVCAAAGAIAAAL